MVNMGSGETCRVRARENMSLNAIEIGTGNHCIGCSTEMNRAVSQTGQQL